MGRLIWDDDDAYFHSDLVKIRLKVDSEADGLADDTRLSSEGADALAFMEQAGQVRLAKRMDGSSMAVGRWPAELYNVKSLRDLILLPARPVAEQAGDPLANLRFMEVDPATPLKEALEVIASDPGVDYVSRVPIRLAAATSPPNPDYQAPPRLALLGNLRQIRWPEARNALGFQEAHNVSVAVLDSGFDPNHEDLIGQFERYNWQYKGTMSPTSDQDHKGHGTHVAGIIGAANTNDLGIKGICRCRLMPYKVFKNKETYTKTTGRFEYIVEPELYYMALASCAEANVQVVNLSIAGFKEDMDETRLIGNLISGGAVVVAAMGNDGTDRAAYPAAIAGVVAVGAVSDEDTIEPYSNRGDHILLCAPGEDIWSTHPTYRGQDHFAMDPSQWPPRPGRREPRKTHYQDQHGTSMAAAHVSGAVALLRAKRPQLTVDEVHRALRESAVMLPEMNNQPTDAHGAGRLDLERLLDWTPA